MDHVHRLQVYGVGLTRTIDSQMDGWDLINRRGISHSNLSPRSTWERLSALRPVVVAVWHGSTVVAPLELTGGRHLAALVLGFRWGLLLRLHNDEGNSFSLPWDRNGRRWGLATATRFWWSSVTVGACSDGRLSLFHGPQATVWHLGARRRVDDPRGGL
jgi:hypothetical protein